MWKIRFLFYMSKLRYATHDFGNDLFNCFKRKKKIIDLLIYLLWFFVIKHQSNDNICVMIFRKNVVITFKRSLKYPKCMTNNNISTTLRNWFSIKHVFFMVTSRETHFMHIKSLCALILFHNNFLILSRKIQQSRHHQISIFECMPFDNGLNKNWQSIC